jgi:hypothetical protein
MFVSFVIFLARHSLSGGGALLWPIHLWLRLVGKRVGAENR